MAKPHSVTIGGSKRFELVTAAYHFLLGVLPFREPESHEALHEFVQTVIRIEARPVDLDSVLIRCLAVLNEHTGMRWPSLVDLYVSHRTYCSEDALPQFARYVTEIVRYRGIGDGFVQQAIEVIRSRHADPTFTTRAVAKAVGRRPSSLCLAFKRHTGLTIGQYVRRVRMDAAASLLAMTNMTIKEVWVRVGYNHPSNFAHDFKELFQMNARDFRARTIRPLAREQRQDVRLPPIERDVEHSSRVELRVMVVDDDMHGSRMVADLLGHDGYSVAVVTNGESALREAERHLPAVILVEYHLRDMNGITFLNLLREKPFSKQPAVALLTADWNVFEHAQQAHALGAIVATKLCDADQIRQLIVTLVSLDVTDSRRRCEV